MECSQDDMSHYLIVKELVHDVVAHFLVYDCPGTYDVECRTKNPGQFTRGRLLCKFRLCRCGLLCEAETVKGFEVGLDTGADL